jgi:hypothetical protein
MGFGILDSRFGILDPRSGIRKNSIPDPGVKKVPDPESTTLHLSYHSFVDYMPLPPVEEDGTVADTSALEFTKVRSCVFLMRIRRLEAVFSQCGG